MTDKHDHSPGPATPAGLFVPSSLKEKVYFFLKRWARSLKYYLRDSHYRTLAHSGLFDTSYYLANDPGLDPRYTDPLIHYLEAGWQEGRKPNPLFDSSYYREMNSECNGSDPLLHYIQQGWHRGADPTPLFFTGWYAAQYPASTKRGKCPLRHYLKKGWREGKKPNPYTDLACYQKAHPELGFERTHPLAHYVEHGFGDRSGPLPFFDAEYYLEDNPSAGTLAMSPLAHYLQYGVREGRSPNRYFDPDYYLERYKDAGPNRLTAFLHFNGIGSERYYRPSRLFDPAYYDRAHPAAAESGLHPLLHYQDKGVYRGYYPCPEVAELERKPVLSIVTPVYNTDARLLRRCIHSALYQPYPHWQLCLADDGSDASHVQEILNHYARVDERIRVRRLEKNQGIAGASNAAVEMATGDYVCFLDHDDELALDALYEVAVAVNEHDPDMLYSDEDLINLESRYLDSFYKPGYNRELLLTHNYVTHLLVTRRDLFGRVGGFSAEYEGAQDFDLVLKLTEQAERIFHIPKKLYHWRASETSTSVNHSQKMYADEAGKKALEAALARRGIDAVVEPGEWRFYYRARRRLTDTPSVSLIVDMVDDNGSAAAWHERMEPFLNHTALEIHLVTGAGANAALLEDRKVPACQIHCIPAGDHANRAAMYNSVTRRAGSEYLLFVGSDIVPGSEEWIKALLEFSQGEKTGAVTGYIESGRAPDRPQIKPGMTWQQFRYFFLYASRDSNNVYCEQNVLAVPVELCMVKRELFERIGGFDESLFRSAFYDIDFCLRLRQQGYENVYTPTCRGYRIDGAGAAVNSGEGEREFAAFRDKWREELLAGDPYYNPGKFLADLAMSRQEWLELYAGT